MMMMNRETCIIIVYIFIFGFVKTGATFISVHGLITCCEKPSIGCENPDSATVSLNEWPHRVLISSEYSSDSSYQITFNHNEYFIDPFIEVKVECPFGTAIVKEKLPIYGGIIEKDFEIANSEY